MGPAGGEGTMGDFLYYWLLMICYNGEMLEKGRVHIFISGEVQGVAFRYYTQDKARALGLTGWIRNLPDGRVEAVFEGSKQKIKEILQWIKQGPELARVINLVVKWEEHKDGWDSFEIRP
jgi:acylphosphatase